MTAPRTIFEIAAEICPEHQQHMPKSERDIQLVKIQYAGSLYDAYAAIDEWLSERQFHVVRHLSHSRLRKAKGREGPGVLGSEPELALNFSE